MSVTESVTFALRRNWEMVDAALADLEVATLERRPNDQSNSIAWILWHMNRVVDTFIQQRFRDVPQLWISEGWCRKYGMDENPDDRGVGWTAEQVSAWKPASREVQLGYYSAVKESTLKYLESLSSAGLERMLVFPPAGEPRSVAAALGQMTWDNVAHGGQIAYLRGYYGGMGWHR